jgi:hypothetical protein
VSEIQYFLATLGGVGLTSAAIVATAYALFKWLGQKWLEAKFSEDLERFKHEKQRELESLRAELSSKITRANFLNQKEFEVLPLLFEKMCQADGAVRGFTSPLQFHADVERLRPAELEELLTSQKFAEFEKEDVRSSSAKVETYRNIKFWKDLNSAHEPFREFRNFLILNSIFIDDDLRTRFNQVDDLLWMAIKEAEREQRYPHPRPDRWQSRDALREKGSELIDEIRNEVRIRLGFLGAV